MRAIARKIIYIVHILTVRGEDMNSSDLFKYYRSSSVRDFEYIVKPGDTLYKISKQFNVSVNDLLNANNISNNLIFPNQSIMIPSVNNSGGVFFEEYVTGPMDTLEGIAQKTNVEVEMLMKYNDVKNLVLTENQTMNIPKQYNKYVVQADDTVDTILRKFFMTPEELIYANRHQWLRAGNTINVK